MAGMMTKTRMIAPVTLAEMRTRCVTITRMAAGEVWSLAKVHQLRFCARALQEQIAELAQSGLFVGELLLLSERLANAIERRARDEAQAATAALADGLERIGSGDPLQDYDGPAPSTTVFQDASTVLGDVPAREHGRVSEEALATVRTIGIRVRQARLASGMSQSQLAGAAGVGRRFLSEFEAGKPTLEIGRVLMVCTAAGVPLMPPADMIAA